MGSQVGLLIYKIIQVYPYKPLLNPSFHSIFHLLFHLVLGKHLRCLGLLSTRDHANILRNASSSNAGSVGFRNLLQAMVLGFRDLWFLVKLFTVRVEVLWGLSVPGVRI